VSAFRGDGALVLCADAAEIDPHAYAPTAIYIDPPYVGRQGYEAVFAAPVEVIAERWARAGHRVVVSEARPIDGASWSREITSLREGQSRRSLTTNPSEWISVWNAQ
jgi:16S rRNA G966 N2-methylase RsmD